MSLRYANALILISKKSGLKQIQNDFESFIKLIESNKNLRLIIKKVFSQFNKLIDIKDGFTEVQLTTSRKLEDEKLKQIEKIISQKINCKVKLKKKVDPQIIGGIIIQIDSFMIDNSVKSKLSENFI